MLVFQPWVGKDYWDKGLAGRRLLILGESHYGEKGSEYPGFTSEVVKEWGQNKRAAFFTKICNLCLNKEDNSVSDEERSDFWEKVSFYNYIQELLPGPRCRPTEEMWAAGATPFLQVVKDLKPNLILVLGKELEGHLPGIEKDLFFVTPHPSSSRFTYEPYMQNLKERFASIPLNLKN